MGKADELIEGLLVSLKEEGLPEEILQSVKHILYGNIPLHILLAGLSSTLEIETLQKDSLVGLTPYEMGVFLTLVEKMSKHLILED